MGMITITCPRCREDFATDIDSGTAVCPSCHCRLLLKKRDPAPAVLDPAAAAPNVTDTLREQTSFVGDKPDALADEGVAALRQGDQLLQRRQFNQALYVFRHAAKEMPEDYRAWWGVTTSTLQHLCAYLEDQRMALEFSPVELVYTKQSAAAQRAMEHTRSLAPADYLPILEDSFAYEQHEAARALIEARKQCRRNRRRHSHFGLRMLLFFIALMLIASGIVCAIFLPLELPGRLLIGTAACIVGLLSCAFAFSV